MKTVKTISTILLSLWMVFVTMGITIYQHVCTKTGDIQISINSPVECKHNNAHKPEKKAEHTCCMHHKACSKHLQKAKKPNCCDKSQFTVYVEVKQKETVVEDIIPHYSFAPVFYLHTPTAAIFAPEGIDQTYIRPPPDIGVSSADILLKKESFLL